MWRADRLSSYSSCLRLIVDVGVIGILDEAGLTILGNPGMVCGYVRFIDLDVIVFIPANGCLRCASGTVTAVFTFHLSGKYSVQY